MSIKIMTEVWDHHFERPIDKMVLLAIADNANDERIAWPSIDTIVRKCSSSNSTVHRSIQWLKQHHYVDRYENKRGQLTFEILAIEHRAGPVSQNGTPPKSD